jgi:hypothetical protein
VAAAAACRWSDLRLAATEAGRTAGSRAGWMPRAGPILASVEPGRVTGRARRAGHWHGATVTVRVRARPEASSSVCHLGYFKSSSDFRSSDLVDSGMIIQVRGKPGCHRDRYGDSAREFELQVDPADHRTVRVTVTGT